MLIDSGIGEGVLFFASYEFALIWPDGNVFKAYSKAINLLLSFPKLSASKSSSVSLLIIFITFSARGYFI